MVRYPGEETDVIVIGITSEPEYLPLLIWRAFREPNLVAVEVLSRSSA